MATVDPASLVAALEVEGWQIVGRGRGHVRLQHDLDERQIFVLTDANPDELEESERAAMVHLRRTAELGERAAAVLARLDGRVNVIASAIAAQRGRQSGGES